jgi:YebC/PmpR family DNA-binding regulatory protein
MDKGGIEMAGHSHSANIAVRKGAQDKARGKLFTKLSKEIMVAVKLGGEDPESNSRLRLALSRARSNSVPKDTIKRAIDKAAGNIEGLVFEDLVFEGYGPGGTAVMVECLTENRNRTAAEVRHAFAKSGGNLGSTGCVGYLFKKKGIIFISEGNEDEIMMMALDAGAEDVTAEEGGFEVVTAPEDFAGCSDALADGGLRVASASVMQIPEVRTTVSGDDAGKLIRLLQLLDDCEDVQAIHHNGDIAADELEALQG